MMGFARTPSAIKAGGGGQAGERWTHASDTGSVLKFCYDAGARTLAASQKHNEASEAQALAMWAGGARGEPPQRQSPPMPKGWAEALAPGMRERLESETQASRSLLGRRESCQPRCLQCHARPLRLRALGRPTQTLRLHAPRAPWGTAQGESDSDRA